MKTMLRRLPIILAGIILLGAAWVPRASWAGGHSFYLKSGWFAWDEKLDGRSLVKERGALHAAGVVRRDLFSAISLAESVEVWGGYLDYDGHEINGITRIKADTAYLGTREEVAVGVRLTTGSVAFEPFAGAGHRFWIRTRSGEDWNIAYLKGGVVCEVARGHTGFFLKGGALLPVYIRNHVSLANAGYNDVVVEPKSRVSAFAEGGVTREGFAVSVEYEGLRFGRSGTVPTSRVPSGNGAVIQNGQAYQPESSSDLVSLKLALMF